MKNLGSEKQRLYQCNICKLNYKEKEWAEKCEDWCRKYKSCNLAITRHALERK